MVSYYPQGLMDLIAAVLRKGILITTGLVDVVDGCVLCGVCDSLCYFVTGLRPLQAIKTLKAHLEDFLRSKGPVEIPGLPGECSGAIGNLLCQHHMLGNFSLFSSSYGTAADNIIDAEFIAADGGIFTLSMKGAPNLFAFRREELPQPGICTRPVVELHPVHEDSAPIAVPFSDLQSATVYAGELNRRDIGLGIGVLGEEYLSTFIAITGELAASLRTIFKLQGQGN